MRRIDVGGRQGRGNPASTEASRRALRNFIRDYWPALAVVAFLVMWSAIAAWGAGA